MTKQSNIISVLCVDDELNILKSLQRVLRSLHLTLYFARSVKEALSMLNKHPIDIVITDMVMPDNNGDKLLKEVNENWPHIKKILLSGYTSKANLSYALNAGGLHYVIEKPWNNEELCGQVMCFAQQAMLEKMNTDTVFCDGAKLLFNIIDNHNNLDSVFAKNVSQTCTTMAIQMGLSQNEINTVHIAGYLCELGLVDADETLLRPYKSLTAASQAMYRQKAASSANWLAKHAGLEKVANILHSQFSPLSSKPEKATLILALARDYWRMRMRKWKHKAMTKQQAMQEIHKVRGLRYDEQVTCCFLAWLKSLPDEITEPRSNRRLLIPNSVLTDDIKTKTGLLLLSKGHRLNDACIARLRKLKNNLPSNVQFAN